VPGLYANHDSRVPRFRSLSSETGLTRVVADLMAAERESCELLLAVARYPDSGQTERIRTLGAKVSDWDALLGLAETHRMLPLLYLRLADADAAAPAPIQERLVAEYRRSACQNLANAAELIAILQVLERAGIPAMPFKGVVLAASAYKDLMARPGGDLDILIHLEDLPRAMPLLFERGYQPMRESGVEEMTAPPHWYEYPFVRPRDGIVLELRWRLGLVKDRYTGTLGLDWAWRNRRTTLLAGAVVPDMCPETKLLMLCMHGAKHMWSRLVWVCDVARLIGVSPGLDWKHAKAEARRQGLGRSLALGVLLAHRVAGAPVLRSVLRSFQRDSTASALADHFAKNILDMPGAVPTGAVPYSIQLLGLRDRVRLFLSWNILRPNERDRATFRLPAPLYPLYYLVRPLRLFRDRSAR